MERIYNYTSNSGVNLLSVVISFNLQERTAPTGIVQSITTILQGSNFMLSLNGEFEVLAFQPRCKCNLHC